MSSVPPEIGPGAAGWLRLIAALIAASIGGGSVGAVGYSALTEYRVDTLERDMRSIAETLPDTQRQIDRLAARLDVSEERASQMELRIFDELRRIRERLDALAEGERHGRHR